MKKTILGISALLVIAPIISLAAYKSAGENVTINVAQSINENAYVAGGNVMFSGSVNGDLSAVGGTVNISGKVSQDIMVAGGNITLSGVSAQDVRIAGGNLSIDGVLSGELMAGGGQITVVSGSRIAKDSSIAGGSVNFNGYESGNLNIYGGSVYVGGTIEKNLTIKGAKNITIGSGAVIKGSLDYTSPNDAVIENGAQIVGTKVFHKVNTNKQVNKAGYFVSVLTFGLMIKFLAILLAVFLLWHFFRKDMVLLLTEASSHFGRELLRGFIFAVVTPVAVVLALITLIGAPVGGFAALIYAALMILAGPITVLVVASLLKKGQTDLRWYHILLSAALVILVMFIPVIGWIAHLIVYLASLGALLNVLYCRFSR
jgi:cytoskeletal protein CcmA (bactofilin family)